MLCCVCGARPASRRLRVSEKFVSYSELFAGGAVCDFCAKLFEDKRFRSSHWIAVGDEVRFLRKEEALELLSDLPENSVVYIKSSGRRYGFLRCMRLSSTKNTAAVCGEDEGPVVVPRERLSKVLDTAITTHKTLKRKSSLLGGCSADEWVHEDVCRAVEELRGDPLWNIVVRLL